MKSLFRKQRHEAQMPTILLETNKRKVLFETDEQYFKRHRKKR